MSILEDVADELAQKTLKLEAATGNEKLVSAVADAIGNTSPTMQEAFQTQVRIRRAERRALEVLARHSPG
jgi:hypothetical protein